MTLSSFFIMHLSKLPTTFVKDGVERSAYHTVEAKELIALGWSEKGEEKAKRVAKPKAEAPKREEMKEEKPKAQRKSLFVKQEKTEANE